MLIANDLGPAPTGDVTGASDSAALLTWFAGARATPGSRMVWSAGAFYITPDQLSIPAHTSMIASRSTTVKVVGTGTRGLKCDANAAGVTVDGLTLWSTDNASATDYGLELVANTGETVSDVTVRNCEIYGFRYRGIRGSANNTDGFLKRFRILNNYVHNIRQSGSVQVGINIGGCDDLLIEGNTLTNIGTAFTDHAIYASSGHRIRIAHNDITASRTAICVSQAEGTISDMAGIVIFGNTTDTLADLMAVQITGGCTGISIVGNVFKGGGRISLVAESDVSIFGNTLDLAGGSADAISIGSAGAGACTNVNVTGNTIKNGTASAIAVYGLNDGAIANNVVVGFLNAFYMVPVASTVTRVAVLGNVCRSQTGSAFEINKCQKLEIANNRVSNAANAYAVNVGTDAANDDIWIHHNRFDNGTTAVRFEGGTNVIYEDNQCANTVATVGSADAPSNRIVQRNRSAGVLVP